MAYSDPMMSWPASNITGLVVRDPQYPESTSRFVYDYAAWSQNGMYMSNGYLYTLWSVYYGDTNGRGLGGNTSDPEPSVGPYAPGYYGSDFYPYHWYHGFTWIQRDNFTSGNYWKPDWAYAGANPGQSGGGPGWVLNQP